MSKTFNRRPISVNIPSNNDVKDYFFTHSNWKGLNDNKNYLTVDEETFSDSNNVYVDEEGLLKSRPSIKNKQILVKISEDDVVLSNILDCWQFEDVKVYKTSVNDVVYLTFVNGDSNVQTSVSQKFKLVLTEKKLFIFELESLRYYDMISKNVLTGTDYIYVPITRTITNGIEEEKLESENEITSSVITRYVYDNFNISDTSVLLNKDVTITIDGVTYTFKWTEDKEKVIVTKISDIYKYKSNSPAYGYDYLIQVSKVGSMIACKEVDSQVWQIDYSVDGVIFNTLPSLSNIVTMPKISDDGKYVSALTSSSLYILNVLSEGDSYTEWTDLMSLKGITHDDTFNISCSHHLVSDDNFCVTYTDTSGKLSYTYRVFNNECSKIYNQYYGSLGTYGDSEQSNNGTNVNDYKAELNFNDVTDLENDERTANFISVNNEPITIKCNSTIEAINYVKLELSNMSITSVNYPFSAAGNGSKPIKFSFTAKASICKDVNGVTTVLVSETETFKDVKVYADNYLTDPESSSTTHMLKLKFKTLLFPDKNTLVISKFKEYLKEDLFLYFNFESDYRYLAILLNVSTYDLHNGEYVPLRTPSLQGILSYDNVDDFRNYDSSLKYTNTVCDSEGYCISYSNTIRYYDVTFKDKYANYINSVYPEQKYDKTTKLYLNASTHTGTCYHTYMLQPGAYEIIQTKIDRRGHSHTFKSIKGTDVKVSAIESFDGAYILTDDSIINSTTYKVYLTYLFNGKPVFYNGSLFLIADGTHLYSNEQGVLDTPLTYDVLTDRGNNYIVPEHICELDHFYFGGINDSGKTLYISSYPSEGDFKWYFPKRNTEELDYDITNLHPISNNEVAVFTRNNVYYIKNNFNDNLMEYQYFYYKSKIPVGCKQGSDVITTYDGKYTLFSTSRGLVAMSYDDFVASTEQTLMYLSDSISNRYSEFTGDSVVKLLKYRFWILCYKMESSILLLLDTRNNSWWKFTFDKNISKLVIFDDELHLLLNNELYYVNKDSSNYHDYDNDNKLNIQWYVKSQKLHLSAPNHYKHIDNITLSSVLDGLSEMHMDLTVTTYRKYMHISKVDSFKFDVDSIRIYVKKLNYFKVNEFQYTLTSDSDDITVPEQYSNIIKVPLSLSSINIKYKISGQVK